MPPVTLEYLRERLELADQLLAGRETMFEPQDLPGRYGRAVKAIDRVLQVMNCPSVLAGGWAVWRHGFVGRITQDLDIVLPADRIDEFLQVAAFAGFDVLPRVPGRWPKLFHRDSQIKVDLLPEGERPGTSSRPAPTTIPPPQAMGAEHATLKYIALPSLMELKLAAGRIADEHDVVELIRANGDQVATIRQHLSGVHADYVAAFDRLVERAREQQDH